MARFVPPPPAAPCCGLIPAPSSKSATHRALVLAALAEGRSRIRRPLLSEDTEATRRGLLALGIEAVAGEAGWEVEGSGGVLEGGGAVHAAASGTTLRLLTAVAALGRRASRLGGSSRLAERPMEPLLQALRALGGHAIRLSPAGDGAFLEAGGVPPRGGAVAIEASQSSQFASALLTIGPLLPEGLDLSLHGPAVSLPYVGLTVETIALFGGEVRAEPTRYRVPPRPLRATEVEVEGDWSSAAYLLTAAVLAGGQVTVEGLRPDSRQADAAIVPLLRRAGGEVKLGGGAAVASGAGRLAALEVDLRHAPDLVPTAAVLALFCEGRSVLRGVAHLRGKESDRVEAVVEGLTGLGRDVRAGPDVLVLEAAIRPLRAAAIRTRGDHRIAMAFAIAALRLPGIELDDPACVGKSYPGFWRDLEAVRTGTPDRPTSRRSRCPAS